MRIQDAQIISASAAEECTPFDNSMDGEIVSIIQQHIAEIPDNKRGGTRMMHTILVKHQNGEIRRHFAPGMYGQGTSLRIENFFKLYPDQVIDCKLVTEEIHTAKGSFFRWILRDVPTLDTSISHEDGAVPDWYGENPTEEVLKEWSDETPDHDASLPGAVGAPVTNQRRASAKDAAF